MKAKKKRLYPELEVGEKVQIERKKAITEKERTSHCLKGEHTVEAINQNWDKPINYTLFDCPRPLLRNELLKV